MTKQSQGPDQKPGLSTASIASHLRAYREISYQIDLAESLTHCRHLIQVSFFSSSFLTFHIHVMEIYLSKESICNLEESWCFYLLSKKKKKIKSPFNLSCCQKGRAKIVKVQRKAVKIIYGMHGRRACHEKKNSKPRDHFIWKGKLPEAQCLQYNKLTTDIGKANQDLAFTFPPKYKNQTI